MHYSAQTEAAYPFQRPSYLGLEQHDHDHDTGYQEGVEQVFYCH